MSKLDRRPGPLVWLLGLALSSPSGAFSAPAPRSDVDWSGSQIPWVDMLGADLSGEFTPYLTFSALQPSVSNAFEIHAIHWDGTGWVLDVVQDGLLAEPKAMTAWRPGAGLANDEIVYAYHTGIPPASLVLSWRPRDIVTGALGVEQDFGSVLADPSGLVNRPSIAVRSDGEPAAAWYSQPPGDPAGTYYARWDSLAVPPQPIELTHLPRCSGGWPTLLLDADDDFHVSCREHLAAGHADINYVYFDGVMPQTEVVFGAGDAHDWRVPAMAFLDDEPAIVAFDVDAAETFLRVRSGGVWQAPVLLATGLPVGHLSIDASGDGAGGGTIAVGLIAGSGVYYTEYTIAGGVGTQGPMRRMDLNPDAGVACEGPRDVGRVLLSADGTRALRAWVANARATEPGHNPLHVGRFTQFRRADAEEWSKVVPSNPVTTSLALNGEGDGWTCFFDDSSAGAPQVDLFVRFRDDPPIVVDADTGYPLAANSRGCDVAVAPDGRLGVSWSRTTDIGGGVLVGELHYRERVGGAFGAIEPILDGLTPVVNEGHLALAFDAWSGAHALFAREQAGLWPWIAHRVGGVWSLDQVDSYEGGLYPDLAFLPGSSKAHTSYVLTTFRGGTVTYTQGPPWVPHDLVWGATCFDTSVSLRQLPGGVVGAVGWVNFSTGQVEFAMVSDKVVRVLDDSPGFNDYLAIEIDGEGEVAASYRKFVPPFSPSLRVSNVRPFSGGQLEPNPPEEGRVSCDIREIEWGTDLELDAFGNPRVMYRATYDSPLAIFPSLDFFTRP